MRSLSSGRTRQQLRAAAGGVLAAAVVAAAGLALTPESSAGRVPAPQSTRSLPAEERQFVPAASEPPEPVAIALPRLGVRSALDPLHLRPDGALQAPPRWDVAGWFVDGPRPGARGPAVVAGHVDGPDGPAVFWRLDELRRGDRVEVGRADGSTAVFAVTRTLAVPKDDFPTAEVYGPTPYSELRLITCDGAFDRSTGHYVDNLVVLATQVEV